SATLLPYHVPSVRSRGATRISTCTRGANVEVADSFPRSCPFGSMERTQRVAVSHDGRCSMKAFSDSGRTSARTLYEWVVRVPTNGPPSTLLLRLMAGGVFFSEGILNFVYPNLGVGRFTKLGFPWPHFTATFVGSLEIVGGLMLIAGLLTRLWAIPF